MNEDKRVLMRGLIDQISQMDPAERAAIAARMPIINTEGKMLSAYNTCLIIMQAHAQDIASPTIVGGFRQWLSQGRCVTKGQSSLVIWFPAKSKGAEGDEDEQHPADLHFMLGNVFDISQTIELAKSEAA